MNTELFGAQLKSLMDKKGHTYTTLSRVSGVGKSLIFNWANGVKPQSIDNLVALSVALNVSVDKLLKGKDSFEKTYKVTVLESGDSL